MTFFARKPALVRTIKPAMKQMAASIRIARISSNLHGTGDCSRDRLHRGHKTLYAFKIKSTAIYGRTISNPPISVVLMNSAIVLNLGLAPNSQPASALSSTIRDEGAVISAHAISLTYGRTATIGAYRCLHFFRARQPRRMARPRCDAG